MNFRCHAGIMKKFFLLLIIAGLFYSCKKESLSVNCTLLSRGIIYNDADKVRTVIDAIIVNLPSQDYNKQNFDLLADKISGQCNLQVSFRCFDCVFSIPSRSEMTLTTDSVGGLTQKKIDISYTFNNKMEFYSLHD